MSYIVGVDVGQAQDFTAIAILEREARQTDRRDEDGRTYWDDHYNVVHLERPPLKTAYPDVVKTIGQAVRHPKLLAAGSELVVDATGVGRPVVDMMRESGMEPHPVTIHGGQEVTAVDGYWRVPKRVLVSALGIVLQTERLHVIRKLPLAETLTREMMNFKVKLSSTAHDSYEAWRDGEHDDLVLAVAMAVWWGERQPLGGFRGGEPDAKERRRQALLTKSERPWWQRRTPRDRR